MNDNTYNLERFVLAQSDNYYEAFDEIKNRGRKMSCWMWYVFPQIHGLGRSFIARKYEIESLEEAQAYLAHSVLGPRLLEMCEAALETESDNPCFVFGAPDELKLKSSMTLFEQANPKEPIFGRVLDKFFHGERDNLTLQILREDN